MDLLDGVTSAALARWRQIFVNLLVGACMAVVSWRLWVLAEKLRDYGDATEYLQIPQAPIVYFACAASAIAAIVMLANVFRYLRGARTPAPGFA
jgi:TRAP-type C4-dicarboxylate transport system permease small subunit